MTELSGKSAHKPSPQTSVKKLLRQARKAYLATLDRQNGGPYASLVTLATSVDGAPLILISKLAVHTQNILADPRVGLVVDGTSAEGDPLAEGRVSLMGRAAVTESDSDKRRFLARHTGAQMYAEFPDFAFYRLEIDSAHYVGGFGRIVDLRALDVLIETEPGILEHMNADHADALALYAAHALGVPQDPASWKMTGIDPEGLDIVGPAGALRIVFPAPIATPGDARKALAALANEARTSTA